jgi:malate dehydrogenase (oxaloacetate-decarboxylating)(NADP+)
MEGYRRALRGKLDPAAASLQLIFDAVRANPKRVVFAEGEEERVIRAAIAFANAGCGTPILIGREELVKEQMAGMGLSPPPGLEIHNARLSTHNKRYTDYVYARLQRKGSLRRDCQRMINQNRNVFAAAMVALGDADAVVTGTTRNWTTCYEDLTRAIGPKKGARVFTLQILIARGRTVFIADTHVHEVPDGAAIAEIALGAAAKARSMGQEPRVALLSFSNFGNPARDRAVRVREAVEILDFKKPDFEYEGDISVDVALDHTLMKELYPFARLSGPANVLVMPSLHAANISARLLTQLGGGTSVGPLLIGLDKPAQIVELGATVSDLVNHAALAAHDAIA